MADMAFFRCTTCRYFTINQLQPSTHPTRLYEDTLLSTVYQYHIHTTRKEQRPTPTHGTAHPIGSSTHGATTTTYARQDSGHRNLVGNHGPQGTIT